MFVSDAVFSVLAALSCPTLCTCGVSVNYLPLALAMGHLSRVTEYRSVIFCLQRQVALQYTGARFCLFNCPFVAKKKKSRTASRATLDLLISSFPTTLTRSWSATTLIVQSVSFSCGAAVPSVVRSLYLYPPLQQHPWRPPGPFAPPPPCPPPLSCPPLPYQ